MPLKNLFLFAAFGVTMSSCNSALGRVFGAEKTPHEVYTDKVEKKPAGKQWVEVSNKILLTPQSIMLPYSQLGYFPAGKPRALALNFTAKRGERINFDLVKNTVSEQTIYADIFKKEGDDFSPVMSADISSTEFGFDVEETGNYILRLQPELDQPVEYSLAVVASPSLGFPVAGNKAKVGGVWGDSRDNGSRSHEGIDIFAAKLTPAIAAADGYISSVKNGGLGGKTVNLKVEGRNLSIYYAHLDKQLVQEGQYVKKGDTLGLVGNTGNAKGMSPHLHFGIYTYGGAIDPLPFVNKETKKAPVVATKNLKSTLQLLQAIKTASNQTINAKTTVVPLAVTNDGYIIELPDGTLMKASLKAVKETRI